MNEFSLFIVGFFATFFGMWFVMPILLFFLRQIGLDRKSVV